MEEFMIIGRIAGAVLGHLGHSEASRLATDLLGLGYFMI
jgi:hypothetical protein